MIFCDKEIQEYDIVEVIEVANGSPEIEVGDIGVILMIFNSGEAFEVECVLENGQSKWQSSLKREQFRWLSRTQ